MAAKRGSGAVVAIAHDDKLVHYKGYGQLDSTKDTPIPLDAVFALASMTKPMAAVAAKILSMKRSSRVSFVSQCTTSLPECAVTGSMFGGAFISCSCSG